MSRVTAAVQRGQAGDQTGAREALEALWEEVGQRGGDAFHRCVIAHFLADVQDDERDELVWDERALAAVAGVTDERAQEYDGSLQVRGFMPSLYLSLADDHRRLGDADRAHEFLGMARTVVDALGDDAYGELVRGGLEKIDRALTDGSTDPLPGQRRRRAVRKLPSARVRSPRPQRQAPAGPRDERPGPCRRTWGINADVFPEILDLHVGHRRDRRRRDATGPARSGVALDRPDITLLATDLA